MHTTQAGFCSFSATNLIVAAGIDLENVDKAKLAAVPIFSIIDLVCGNFMLFIWKLSNQIPTNIDEGIVPNKPSYSITMKNVTFAYPARPDIRVRRLIVRVAVLYVANCSHG